MFSKSKRLLPILLAALLACPSALSAHFLDTSGNWAETYINILSDKGIIPAEADGKFKPDDPVSRAVLADWLVKVLGLEKQPVPDKPSFADVKTSDWFYKPVEIIRQNNYISGYSDGFRPNQFIQKGEIISIISRALNRPAPDDTQIEDELARYKDASRVPSWARLGVAETSLAGILLIGPDTQSIGADKLATRADATAILYKLDEYLARRDGSDAVKRTTGQARPYPQGALPYSPSPAGGPPPPQGEASKGDYFGIQNQYSGSAPQYGTAYSPAPPQYGAPVLPPLQGSIVVLAAGTRFKAQLKNTLSSASTQTGEEIRATINEPIYASGSEVIPAGSQLIGQASSVTPAHRFRAGAGGKMGIKFTSIETPDGRKIPLSASVDESEQRLSSGTTAGRVGKGLLTTGVGAASGAAVGTTLGAIVGGTSGGNMGSSIGMGAVFGTALGAGVGGVTALVRKGSEVRLRAGSSLPIKLDESMTVQMPQFSAPSPFQPPRN